MRGSFKSKMGAMVALGAASLMLGAGCSPSPKSDELVELERMLQDPAAQDLRDIPNAARFHQEARQLRLVSEEAREERNDELSQEYAVLGTLRYRTAVAIAKQFEAAERLKVANAKIEEVNPDLRATNETRNALARDIQQLDAEIRTAVREREARRQAEASRRESTFNAAQRDNADTSTQDLQQVNARIEAAEAARAAALEYKADAYERSRAVFNRAESQLSNARDLLRSQPGAAGTILQQVNFAVQLFEEAANTAKPIHEEMVEKMRPENRISVLRQMASDNFGRPYTEEEYQGVRIVMARMFEPQEANFRQNTDAMLDVLARLVKEYGEFSVQIEGYTQRRGGVTENLATSQLRAHRVRDFLVERGVELERISTEGFGQERLRFSDDAENNDRVEIILRHSGR
ncbi:OmpA family protein [Lujinxingia litoralis]|nr:OmpA family protein [Lujinxingia litoralis]